MSQGLISHALPSLCPECLTPAIPYPCHLPDHQVPAPPAGISVHDRCQQPTPHWTACPDCPRPSSPGHLFQAQIRSLSLPEVSPCSPSSWACPGSCRCRPCPSAAPPPQRPLHSGHPGPAGGSLPLGACALAVPPPLPPDGS